MNEHLGPNDIPQLYECLKAALSQDQHRQKQAEATLVDLEDRHGYTSCLAVSASLVYLSSWDVPVIVSTKYIWHVHAGDHWQ